MHACAVLSWVAVLAAEPAARPTDGDAAFPPHRIADNLYYVGSKKLASYLVTTGKGHILINPDFERTVPLIRDSIEKLGFKLADVKILLSSHAHDDHVEGYAAMKELTGGQVQVMEGDDQVVANGGAGQYLYDSRWKPTRVDRVLKDGDRVTLGGTTLVARRTPGHTRGCTTWTMTARDAGKRYQVVIVGSPNVNPGYELVNNKVYPEIAKDYARSFKVWKGLRCDIFLGAHGQYYGLEAKHARLEKGEKTPFVDPAGYKAYIDDREKAFNATLEAQKKQQKEPAAPP